MEEKQKEILKRKKIRKLLLLKINDELKHISKFKSNIRINSKTIQELNAIYNNDILLFEKSTIYSNYIKTEETIISNNISSIHLTKTISHPIIKTRTRNKNKDKNKEETNKISIIEMTSLEEDSTSPIISDFPKKIELGGKKFLKNRPKHRNNCSINIRNIPKKISSEKEIIKNNPLNKSTKIGNGDLHKLIEKINLKNNNESREGIIKENLKKLRKYCYKLRKKRKKVRKFSVNKNSSFRKSKEKEKKNERDCFKKRSTKLCKDIIEKSLFLIDKNNNHSKSIVKIDSSPSPSPHFNLVRKKSTAKIIKLNLNNNKYKINILAHSKNNKNYSSIKTKEKVKKLQTLNEIPENKFVNKLTKKKLKKSFITEDKTNTEENTPYINNIKKDIMRSNINEMKMKFDSNEEGDKKKPKYNKLKLNNKKMLNKNISINVSNFGENERFKYFNYINNKKDKVELHDGLIKSSKKLRKFKENTRKSQENDEEIIKLKKLSIVLDSRKKSKKNLIDSPDRRICRKSNFTNYMTTNSNKNHQLINEKNNKSFVKKPKKIKD